jgi:hypothetical protein
MAGPDFLILGAQRSGTTWLHKNLSAHPKLWMTPIKELHYFDDPLRRKRHRVRRLVLQRLRQGAAYTSNGIFAFSSAASRMTNGTPRFSRTHRRAG